MEIVVKGRNVEVPDHYRELVEEKIDSTISKFDAKAMHIDVELYHERNPRQSDHAQRVEITCRRKGPVIRAEASAADFRSAFEKASGKLATRLRKAADRKRIHAGGKSRPKSLAEASASLVNGGGGPLAGSAAVLEAPNNHKPKPEDVHFVSEDIDHFADIVEDHLPGQIVREKSHSGEPMTVDDALQNMELVGHDFYLFHDKDSGKPSVVYRRHAYDYGLLRLDM
ncbi:ribosome hibernation-promoting factor, HPF/YfiA family [Haloglycomyces albus]|uniref:ribosome hibernation-promoting factor, HPF/YfiA family n=1 Tax=Haloglycomyces albus TaxID=526067 RepID=UPI00046D48E2|nr:ribosome-associated translation inhibitor RaiA [Haloglycomyces albus]